MRGMFDMWISPGLRLLTLHLIVKSWGVCIPGGQECASVHEVAADASKRWCALKRNLALKKNSLCITHPLQNQVPHSQLSGTDELCDHGCFKRKNKFEKPFLIPAKWKS